jgi:hypothetical protein
MFGTTAAVASIFGINPVEMIHAAALQIFALGLQVFAELIPAGMTCPAFVGAGISECGAIATVRSQIVAQWHASSTGFAWNSSSRVIFSSQESIEWN